MIATSAALALRDVLSPPFRAALVKTLALTITFLAATWFALLEAAERLLGTRFSAWLGYLPDWANADAWSTGLGWAGWIVLGMVLSLALAFLIAPVSAVVAGIFLDDAAEAIEREHYPAHAVGKALPLATAIPMALRFFLVVVVANLLGLVLLLIPGVNVVAFLLVNGYLLGREFFDFAAMRQRPIPVARELRRRNAGTVMLGGLVIAALLAVPIANLLTPLFGAAMMVHLHKRVAERDRFVANVPAGAALGRPSPR